MASLKIVLRTNKKKVDGTCPLALRIIKDRKARFIFTGQYIHEKDWDQVLSKVRKSHPNSGRLNGLLLKKLSEANELLLESESSSTPNSSKQIKNKIKRIGKEISFFALAEQRNKEYQQKGTWSVSNSEQSFVNNIKKYVKDEELYFQDITVPFLEKLKVYCKSELKQSPRSITNHLIFIRTLFNRAIKEGIVDAKYYPFGGNNVKIRLGNSMKIGLTKEEIIRIEKLKLKSGTTIWHAKNIWLFSFYFAGIRISDVLKMRWSDFKDDRLYYVMHKNNKPISLKIPEKAKKILKLYQKNKKKSDDYIFPGLGKAIQEDPKDMFIKNRNATRLYDKYLVKIGEKAKINKKLSHHIARHSFGNIAGDKIHPLMLQKLYRHSDLKTTINYQANFIHKEADEALDKVVDF
jgi:integrase